MNEELSTNEFGVASDGSPHYDQYLPGPIQVLVNWLILIFSTIATFFKRKNGEEE